MSKWSILVFGLALTLYAEHAAADEIQGLVRIVGNDAYSKVVLTPESAFVGPHLCASENNNKIRKLDSMVVKTEGKWLTPTPTEKCFEVASFTVLKTPAGHDATVGTVAQSGNILQVRTDDGRNLTIKDPSKDLRKLLGKKVIIDAQSVGEHFADKDAPYKIVYFSEFP